VLSHQPQGGFITRKPTPNVLVASDDFRGGDGFNPFFQRSWEPQPPQQPVNARRRGGQQYYQPMQPVQPAQPRWW
jgi:hypothetical protein